MGEHRLQRLGVLRALFTRADITYSRDASTLLLLSLLKPRRSLVYEAHQFSPSKRGQTVQRWLVKRV